MLTFAKSPRRTTGVRRRARNTARRPAHVRSIDSPRTNQSRWCDASVGRWLSQDPIGFAGDDANLYRYVGNAPTDGTDPSGLAQASAAPEARQGRVRARLARVFTAGPAIQAVLIRDIVNEGIMAQIAAGNLNNDGTIKDFEVAVPIGVFYSVPVAAKITVKNVKVTSDERTITQTIRKRSRQVPAGIQVKQVQVGTLYRGTWEVEQTIQAGKTDIQKDLTDLMNLGEGLVKEFPAIINAFAGGVKEAATELVQGIGGLFKPEAGGPGAQVPNAKEATPDELRQGGTGDATTTVSLNGAKIASLTVKFKSGAVLGADETSKPEWSYANDANLDTLLDALPDTDSLSKLRLTNVLSTLKSKLVSVEYTLKYKFDGRIGFTSGKK